jgi:hypothetical protein
MYSKDVGDFDVRITNERELTYDSLYERPLTSEHGFQTELFDTKRDVGYIKRSLKPADEDIIEEQRQEVITFRLPLEARTTEEIYETTITTETKQNNRQYEEIRSKNKLENIDTTIVKSEMTEWTRSLGNNEQKKRLNSPEELVEESYEVVSTLTKPKYGEFLITSSSPRSTVIQRYGDVSTTKLQSSEDDSSYCEEWTVTEAKRKEDGQTMRTIIDR